MEKFRPNYQFEYKRWTVAVKLDATPSGSKLRGVADLHLNEGFVHEIALPSGFLQGSAAIADLVTRARTYIDAQPPKAARPYEPSAER